MHIMQFFLIEGENNPIIIRQTGVESNKFVDIDFFSSKSNTGNKIVKEIKARTAYNYYYDKYKDEVKNKLEKEGIETNSKNLNSRMGKEWALCKKEKKDKEYFILKYILQIL